MNILFSVRVRFQWNFWEWLIYLLVLQVINLQTRHDEELKYESQNKYIFNLKLKLVHIKKKRNYKSSRIIKE